MPQTWATPRHPFTARPAFSHRTYDGSLTPDLQTGVAMIQVRVLGIALDAAQQHIVLLKPLLEEPGAGNVLPIWIGPQEATSILLAISGEQPPRPLTHDLMKTLLDTVGATVDRVEVTRIEEGTFYAELSLTTPTGQVVLDTRPSDAVALAVRTEAPLLIAEELLDEAGIPAEVAEPRTEEEEKVDEFKKFLDDVDPEDFQG
jgi:bifunctional DNase/RNase